MTERKRLVRRIREAYAFNVPELLKIRSEVSSRAGPITHGIGQQDLLSFRGNRRGSPPDKVEIRSKDHVISTWAFNPELLPHVPAEVLTAMRGNPVTGKGMNKAYAEMLDLHNLWQDIAESKATLDSRALQDHMSTLTDEFANRYERYCAELEYVYQQTTGSEAWYKAKRHARKHRTNLTITAILGTAALGMAIAPEVVPSWIETAVAAVSVGLFAATVPGGWRESSRRHRLKHLVGSFHPRYKELSAGHSPTLVRKVDEPSKRAD